jgi:hypothetical protein
MKIVPGMPVEATGDDGLHPSVDEKLQKEMDLENEKRVSEEDVKVVVVVVVEDGAMIRESGMP